MLTTAMARVNRMLGRRRGRAGAERAKMNHDNFRKLFAKAPEKFPVGLEKRYPRVLQEILSRWDSPRDLENYMRGLVVDDRGNRQGFPPEILKEILFLSGLFERWRAERKRRVDPETLHGLRPELAEELDRCQQPLTPELSARLSQLKQAVSRDDLSALEGQEEFYNQKDRDGMTLTMHAASAGSEKCLIHLLKKRANPHLADSAGNQALHWAVTMSKLRSSEILLFFGALPMTRNHAGATALTLAAIKPDPALVGRLLDYGADPNTPDGRGEFALHKAVGSGAQETVRFLLANGASKDMRNRDGKTPEALAKPDMLRVFERHQADLIRSAMSK